MENNTLKFFEHNKHLLKCCAACDHATRPRGGHCNYQGAFLNHFLPQLLATDRHEVQDLLLLNPSDKSLTKVSTVFPLKYSPMECTQKVIESISGENKKIIPMKRLGILKIVAYTKENIEIVAFYDTRQSKLTLFYPNFQEVL